MEPKIRSTVCTETPASVATASSRTAGRNSRRIAAAADVAAEFADLETGDVSGAVQAYVNHYEKAGDLVVRNIQDESDPEIHSFVEHGRTAQRAGISRLFAPFLDPLADSHKARTVDLLVVAMDVYTWKRLRRDMGRSRPDTEVAMLALVNAILEVLP